MVDQLLDRYFEVLDVEDSIQGRAKDELIGEDLRQHRRLMRETAPHEERRAVAASLRAALIDVGAALDELSAATSRQEEATAGLRLELARDRLERRLAHEPLAPLGQTHETLDPRAPPAFGPLNTSSRREDAGPLAGRHVQRHD